MLVITHYHVFFIPHILQIEFFPYTDHGDLWWKDGEYFARKVNLFKPRKSNEQPPQGVGRVRVEPHPNVTVDVFVTHTCAEDYNYW